MRILVAGVLGGIAMFLWAFVAHMFTDLAAIGMSPMPNEAVASAALHANLGDKPGLYFSPYAPGGGGDDKAMAAQAAKMKTSPQVFMAYLPPRADSGMGRQLATEFGLEVFESLLAAFLISYAVGAGFTGRVTIAAMVGLVAGVSTNFSYWNWYGFDLDYTLANAFTELVKYVVAGVVIALVMGRKKAAAS